MLGMRWPLNIIELYAFDAQAKGTQCVFDGKLQSCQEEQVVAIVIIMTAVSW